ncbi:YbaB/EbfC family nucleoid-associated protein [Micromonospora carbonacea]|uniref:YbaB/EbfC family nucleoid-associated protein n=2 Tax=Micromonospora carbonacea TaxID=47853 RepID=A0A7H8XEF3_9ACTN|nr:YbaB/EbfC family nucleoid-associated protein [Micromonospora carbonacea]QLD23337.1 YbaB/EbfC family nucleoid-associated protein [Micromonospora carbonacea]
MAEPVDPSGLGRALSETMSALDSITSTAEGSPRPEGFGEGADGMVTVTVVPPGEVAELTLDPRVMRLPSETLAEEITSAVNQALTDLRGKATTIGPIDLSGLGDTLRRIQEDTGRRLTAFTDALVQAQDRMAARGGR